MNRIKDVVEKIIENNPLYSLAMRSGFVNFTSLSKSIKPTVDSMLEKDVKLNTLVKILSSLDIYAGSWDRQSKILKESNISMEYRYTEIELDKFPDEPINFLFAYQYRNKYRFIVQDQNRGNMACIRILLPDHGSDVPGITFTVAEYLSVQNIKIEKIYRLDREILLICNHNIADTVLKNLTDLIIKQ